MFFLEISYCEEMEIENWANGVNFNVNTFKIILCMYYAIKHDL